MEDRSVDSMSWPDARLDPHFGGVAGRRLQREIEPCAPVPVGELGEGRRLEAVAIACVDIEIVVCMKHHAEHGAGVVEPLCAAVVRVRLRNVVVDRFVVNRARADTGRCRPCRGQAPFSLRIHVV
jgi:hypothetical protein